MKLELLFLFLSICAPPVFAQADPLNAAYIPPVDTNCAHSQYASNVWMTNSLTKLRQDLGNNPGSACTLTIYGTQNEFVDFQVHLHDAGSGTAGLKVTVSNFVQSSPASSTITCTGNQCIVYAEGYYQVTTKTGSASTFYNSTGYYPDVLVPTVDPYYNQTTNAFPITVSAGNNQSAWIDVLIPSGSPAGYYLGSVTVQTGCPSSCTIIATMPVTIAVWSWPSGGKMPSTSSLQSWTTSGYAYACNQFFNGGYNNCGSYPGSGGGKDKGVMLAIIDLSVLMLDHRWSAAAPISTTQSAASPGTDMVTYYGPLYNGTNANTHTILSGAKVNTAEIPGNINSYAANYTAFYSLHGWSSTLYDYATDEPGSNCSVPAWTTTIPNAATAMHGVSPMIPTLVTTDIAYTTSCGGLNYIDWMVVDDVLMEPVYNPGLTRSTYNTWLSGNCCGAGSPKRQVWAYLACGEGGTCTNGAPGGTSYSYPNYDIDGVPAANRAQEWLTFLHAETGELYYDAEYCWFLGNDPWTSQYFFGNNGDGSLIYPSTSGTTNHVLASGGGALTDPIYLPSIRLKNMRDSMQDYEYLHELNSLGYGSTVTAQISTWITNSYTFETTGSGLIAARTNLGNFMHALSYIVTNLNGGITFSGGIKIQ